MNIEQILKMTREFSDTKNVHICLYCAEIALLEINHAKDIARDHISSLRKWLINKVRTPPEIRFPMKFDFPKRHAEYIIGWIAEYNAHASTVAAYCLWNGDLMGNNKISQIIDILTKSLPKTPYTDPLEIIVYLQDQVGVPILDGNRLNLWNKDQAYQITGTVAEIAKAPGISDLINALTY